MLMRSRFTINCLAFYCIIATGLVNTCFAGNNQLPELKVFDGAQVYEKGIQAQRQREEIRRIQLQN